MEYTLIQVKNEIKSALIDKGIEVDEGLTEYAKYINRIGNTMLNISFGESTLKTFSLPNLSVDTCREMFFNCTALTTVDYFDTSSATDMYQMFYHCTALTDVAQFDTRNVTNMYQVFAYCTSITSVPLLDASKVELIADPFYQCAKLTDVGGFRNLGKVRDMQDGVRHIAPPNITRESLLNIINNLYDRAAAGYPTNWISISQNIISKLNDDEIAMLIRKGWVLYT